MTLQDAASPEGRQVEAPALSAPFRNLIEYFLNCLEQDLPIEGPLSIETSRIGQQIVDTAYESAKEGKALPLVGE